MQRMMFDTNVYEQLYILEPELFAQKLASKNIVVYGCRQIRDELRAIPKTMIHDGKSFRNALLSIYDSLIGNRSFPVEGLSHFLVEEYWKEYQGGMPKRKLIPDFIIVSVASIHHLDILISEDFHSMKSMKAIQAYKIVNERNGLKTPRLLQFQNFMV